MRHYRRMHDGQTDGRTRCCAYYPRDAMLARVKIRLYKMCIVIVRLAGCENVIMSDRSLYSMRLFILSQCRDLKMGVI